MFPTERVASRQCAAPLTPNLFRSDAHNEFTYSVDVRFIDKPRDIVRRYQFRYGCMFALNEGHASRQVLERLVRNRQGMVEIGAVQ